MWNHIRQFNSRVLICDTKPRFRCQWDINGINAGHRYRKWDPKKGTFLPNSYRVPIDSEYGKSLDYIFKHSNIAVIQTNDIAEWGGVLACARVFYERYSARIPRLLIPDELSDFFEVQKQGGIFWQAARSGREINLALLGGCQRPRYLPKVVLTESDRIYLFRLDYADDMKAMYECGIPKNTPSPETPHAFYYYDKFLGTQSPSGKEYILDMKGG